MSSAGWPAPDPATMLKRTWGNRYICVSCGTCAVPRGIDGADGTVEVAIGETVALGDTFASELPDGLALGIDGALQAMAIAATAASTLTR